MNLKKLNDIKDLLSNDHVISLIKEIIKNKKTLKEITKSFSYIWTIGTKSDTILDTIDRLWLYCFMSSSYENSEDKAEDANKAMNSYLNFKKSRRKS